MHSKPNCRRSVVSSKRNERGACATGSAGQFLRPGSSSKPASVVSSVVTGFEDKSASVCCHRRRQELELEIGSRLSKKNRWS